MNSIIELLTVILKSIFANKKVPEKPVLVDEVTVSTSELKAFIGTKIVIDPGHGGKNGKRDPGAVGRLDSEEIYERDVVLKICEKLAYKLDSLGIEVVMTRIDNDPQARSTLGAKVRIVKLEKPDLFISVHANANSGTPAQGIETFYDSGSEESRNLAKFIQSSLIFHFPLHKDRGLKNGSHLYVLKSTPLVPARCLIECEFINHPEQVKFLLNKQDEIAEAISIGIQKYLNKSKSGAK